MKKNKSELTILLRKTLTEADQIRVASWYTEPIRGLAFTDFRLE